MTQAKWDDLLTSHRHLSNQLSMIRTRRQNLSPSLSLHHYSTTLSPSAPVGDDGKRACTAAPRGAQRGIWKLNLSKGPFQGFQFLVKNNCFWAHTFTHESSHHSQRQLPECSRDSSNSAWIASFLPSSAGRAQEWRQETGAGTRGIPL